MQGFYSNQISQKFLEGILWPIYKLSTPNFTSHPVSPRSVVSRARSQARWTETTARVMLPGTEMRNRCHGSRGPAPREREDPGAPPSPSVVVWAMSPSVTPGEKRGRRSPSGPLTGWLRSTPHGDTQPHPASHLGARTQSGPSFSPGRRVRSFQWKTGWSIPSQK